MTSAALALSRLQRSRAFEMTSDYAARVGVGSLFLALAWSLGADFLKTGRPTDLLLLVGEALVVILTCLRRRAHVVDCSLAARVITGLSMISPMLIRPGEGAGVISEVAASTVAGVGLLIVILGKLSLGYSFGLLPANRGVKDRGLYRVVRHPIYLGYLVTHIPFLAAHPTAWNLLIIVVADTALIMRMFYEEQTLSRDPQYVRYRSEVKWRLVPGVC
jgi:protein-S-isoprenylcysteine O-methyltransferase Ste14